MFTRPALSLAKSLGLQDGYNLPGPPKNLWTKKIMFSSRSEFTFESATAESKSPEAILESSLKYFFCRDVF